MTDGTAITKIEIFMYDYSTELKISKVFGSNDGNETRNQIIAEDGMTFYGFAS